MLEILLVAMGMQALSAVEPAPVPGRAPAVSARAGAAKARRQRLVAEMAGFDAIEGPATEALEGATRGNPYPVPVAPRMGRVYDTRPSFGWLFPGEGAEFTWRLLDGAQAEVATREGVTSQLSFPEGIAALEPGATYFWAVEAPARVGKPRRSALMGVKVLEPGLRDGVAEALARAGKPGTQAGDLARAKVFIDLKLWYDSVAALSRLIASYPGDVKLYELRGAIFSQLAWTRSLADQDFAKADELLAASGSP